MEIEVEEPCMQGKRGRGKKGGEERFEAHHRYTSLSGATNTNMQNQIVNKRRRREEEEEEEEERNSQYKGNIKAKREWVCQGKGLVG